ncbi:sugar transferase [Spirosoma pulveris]
MLSLNSHFKPHYLETELLATNQESIYLRLGKRAFDLAFALLVALFVLSWLIPVLALLICLESNGPVFFIQKRTGYRGKWFNCFKFRTMKHQPNAAFQQAKKTDRRVTRIGGLLRRTNIDEMPQFINVILGDMSIVGPRPHALEHSAQYWHTLPDYRKRYEIKPGITGLAQVRGCRGETEELIKMQHRIKYDRFYSQKKSPALDLWIGWLTIKSLLNGNVNAW